MEVFPLQKVCFPLMSSIISIEVFINIWKGTYDAKFTFCTFWTSTWFDTTSRNFPSGEKRAVSHCLAIRFFKCVKNEPFKKTTPLLSYNWLAQLFT